MFYVALTIVNFAASVEINSGLCKVSRMPGTGCVYDSNIVALLQLVYISLCIDQQSYSYFQRSCEDAIPRVLNIGSVYVSGSDTNYCVS